MSIESIAERIKSYVFTNLKSYGMKWRLGKFFNENPDILDFVHHRLEEESWYQNKESNVLATVAMDKYPPVFCPTCGKELSVESVRRGAIFCSGGCKSKNQLKHYNFS